MSIKRSRVVPKDSDAGDSDGDGPTGTAASVWGARQRSHKKCVFVDGKTLTRFDEADYRMTGDYFTDISFKEREFVVTEASLRAHPDTVLRESGVIKQTGRYGNFGTHEVCYEPKVRRWVYCNKATIGKLSVDGDSLIARKDTPPTGVIRIIGEIEFHKFQLASAKSVGTVVKGQGGSLKLTRRPSMAKQRRSLDHEVRHVDHAGYEDLMDSGDERNLNETTGLGEAGDEDTSFMSDLEVSKHIKQYLSRALPSLVTQSGMAVLHSGVGSISQQLSKGMAIYEAMDPDDDDDEDDGGEGTNNKHHPGACVCIVPTNLRHNVKQHFTHCILLRRDLDGVGDDSDTISQREIIAFINRIVESLSEGLASSEDKWERKNSSKNNPVRKPPPRPPVPCCALLIGGHHTLAPMELMQSVTRRDSVVVVQGSKGYADSLCDIIDAVHDYNPNAGLDDFQTFLGTADALTEQIVMTYLTGKLIVVKKGTKVEEFQRRLHSCLRGDEALVKAWAKYAQWNVNVEQQRRVYLVFNYLILLLSICATLVTVVMTFTRLMWQIKGRPYPEVWNSRDPTPDETGHFMLYFGLTWATIGFPILLALVQAVYNKVNPSSKLVSLRVATEDVLRQIYMYRTRTLDYSAEKCKEHDPNTPGYVKSKDGLVYSTREELLAYAVNSNTDKLSRSAVANVALSPYTGSLPPKDIKSCDSGFHDLSPDEYIEIRLRTKRKQLQELSNLYQLQSNIVNVAIHCCSGVGTCLAAIAANGYGYLQTWIAFTTALVNSLQRYSDFSNLTKMHEQYNKTDNNLSNVEIWFAKLGESKDGMQNRNQLVKKTEEHINEEVETWARLLQSVAARMKGLDDGKDSERKRELQMGKDKKEGQKMREMGFEGLSQENFKKALENPQGPQAKKLHQCLAKLNDDLGDVVSTGPREKEKKAAPKEIVAVAVDTDESASPTKKAEEVDLREVGALMKHLPTVPKKFADACTAHNVSLAMDELLGTAEKPGNLTSANAACVSHQRLLNILSKVPGIGRVLQTLPQREFLECMKGIVLFYVVEQVFSPQKGMKVRVRDITPSAGDLEDLLNEMNVILVKTEGIDPSRPEMVLSQIRDEGIRDCLTKLKQTQLATLFQIMEQLLTSSKDVIGAQGGANIMFLLLENCSVQVAELDVESIMEDIDERLALWDELKDLPRSTSCTLETMNRDELLHMLPNRFRTVMKQRSVFQIAAAVSVLQAGTPSSRVFEALLSRPRETLPELGGSFFDNPAIRERFVMAAEPITQDIINRKTKGDLIRMLRLHKSFTSDLSDFVTDLRDDSLKKILSHIQALFSNGYAGRVIDRLNDELTFFDVKGLLTIEEREKLVGKLREFRDLQPKLAKMNKAQLLAAIGYPKLQVKLSKLDHPQLGDLVFTLTWVLKIARQRRLWNRLCTAMKMKSLSQTHQGLWGPVSDEVVDHMFSYARGMRTTYVEGDTSHIELNDLEKYKRDETPEKLLHYLGDSLLTSALLNTPPKEILEMLRMIHKTFGDPLVSDVFEICGNGITSAGGESQHAKFAALFLTGHGSEDHQMFDEDSFYKEPQRKRNSMLRAILGVSLKEVREVREMDPCALLKCLTQQSGDGVRGMLDELHDAGLDEVEVQDIVARLLSELVVSLPLRIFRQACDTIGGFDVRGLLTQLPVRYLFPCLMFLLMHDGSISLASGTVSIGKKKILQIIRSFPVFSQTSSSLRDFTDVQLQEFCTVVCTMMQTAPGGMFFYSYCEKLLEESLDTEDFVTKQLTNLSVTVFKNKIRTSMGKCSVKTLFCDWDVRKFLQIKQADKARELQKYLEDAELVDLFINMPADRLEDIIAHLRPLDHPQVLGYESDENDHTKLLIAELSKKPLYSDEEDEEGEGEGFINTPPQILPPPDTMSGMYSDEPQYSDDDT